MERDTIYSETGVMDPRRALDRLDKLNAEHDEIMEGDEYGNVNKEALFKMRYKILCEGLKLSTGRRIY